MRGVYKDHEGDHWPLDNDYIDVTSVRYYGHITGVYDDNYSSIYYLGPDEELLASFDMTYVMPLELMKGGSA